MKRRKVTEKNLGCYVQPDYKRTYRGRGKYGLNEGTITLRSYKGTITIDTEGPTGVWLRGAEFDDLIKLLREAKKVCREDLRISLAIANCVECQTSPVWSCPRHRAVINRFKAKVEK